MKSPKRIKTNGTTVAVDSDVKLLNAADADGHYDPSGERICVNPELPPARQRVVLLHEVLHVAWFYGGLSNFFENTKQEEAIVDVLAKQLVPLLRENPRLVEFLTAPE